MKHTDFYFNTLKIVILNFPHQLTGDEPIRAVIRNIHLSTDVNVIKKLLTDLSFSVKQVTNVSYKTTKFSLPLFLDLEKSDTSLEIVQLSSFLYTKKS